MFLNMLEKMKHTLDVTKRVEGDFKEASHLAQQIKNEIRE